jgi:thioredoxin-like negative regulator of GroEL
MRTANTRFTTAFLGLFMSGICIASTHEQSGTSQQGDVATRTSVPKSAAVVQRKDAAGEAFRRGANLVDRNCGECMDATRAGLSAGIDSLKKAIQLRYHDPAAAHRLLRDAYGNMPAFLKHSDPERKAYEALRNIEIAKIVKLDPSDLDNRLEYIEYVRQSADAAETVALSKLVTEHPAYWRGQYALARRLFEMGSEEDALPHAEQWLADATGTEEMRADIESLFEFVSAARLRRIAALAPSFHPAQYALALQLLQSGSTAEALEHARRALEQATAVMAALYFESLNGTTIAANLRREFNEKLDKGEAEIKADRP